MPTDDHPRDRFDDIPRDARRIGAHRAERPRGRWVVVLLWVLIVLVVLAAAGTLGFIAILNDSSLTGAAVPVGVALSDGAASALVALR